MSARLPARRGGAQVIQFSAPNLRAYKVIAVNQAGERIERTVWAAHTIDAINDMHDQLGFVPRYCRAVPAQGVRSGTFSDTEPVMSTEPAQLDKPTFAEVAQMQLESQRVAQFEHARRARAARRGWALGALVSVAFWVGAIGLAHTYWGGL